MCLCVACMHVHWTLFSCSIWPMKPPFENEIEKLVMIWCWSDHMVANMKKTELVNLKFRVYPLHQLLTVIHLSFCSYDQTVNHEENGKIVVILGYAYQLLEVWLWNDNWLTTVVIAYALPAVVTSMLWYYNIMTAWSIYYKQMNTGISAKAQDWLQF